MENADNLISRRTLKDKAGAILGKAIVVTILRAFDLDIFVLMQQSIICMKCGKRFIEFFPFTVRIVSH